MLSSSFENLLETVPGTSEPARHMLCERHPSETVKYFCRSIDCERNFQCGECDCEHFLMRRPLDQFDDETIRNELRNLFSNYRFKFAHFKQLIGFFEESVQIMHEKEKLELTKLTEKFDCVKKVILTMFKECAENLKFDYHAKKSKFANILNDLRATVDLVNANCSSIQDLTVDRNNNHAVLNRFELLNRYKKTLREFEVFSKQNQTLETNVKVLLNDKTEICANLEKYFEPLALELAKMNLMETSGVGAIDKSSDLSIFSSKSNESDGDGGGGAASCSIVRPSFASTGYGDDSGLGLSTKHVNQMTIRVQFGHLGPSRGQFRSPHGFCLSPKEEIVIADTLNHRIQIFDKNGIFLTQFGSIGREDGYFWYPRKIAMFTNTEDLVISDRGRDRSRVQLFTRNGHFLRKISLTKIDIVAGVIVLPSNEQIAIMDSVKPAILLYAKNGTLLHFFDCSKFIVEPSDLTFYDNKFYVCDFKGHDIVVVDTDGKLVRKIGSAHITNYPNGIDITPHGEILVGDSHGNKFHVSIFNSRFELIGEFECADIKVSRCCGLKISTEGYIITLAKNNNHVLILNTLYLPK